MDKGIIYILTNDSMPGLIKIGITNRPIRERLKELDSTELPTPFNLYYAIEIDNYKQKEKLIHKAYAKDRIRLNREFFKVEPENATALLKAVGGKEIDPSNINITIDETGKEISPDTFDARLPQAPITTFEMLDIPLGSTLTFTRDDRIECEVVENRKVEFKGEITSLSQLSRSILHKFYNWKSNYINGFQFWEFENEILTDRRSRLENERMYD